MTRIAFVSDIHGNLPAFEAVLAQLDRRGPFDAVVGGGDFALGGAYPAACVRRLRELGWSCVLGNTDEWVAMAGMGSRMPERDYPDKVAPNQTQLETAQWVASQLDGAGVEFLAGLPFQWETTGPSGQKLAFVHATPWSPHPSIGPDAEEATYQRMLDQSGADTLLYGHIHYAYQKDVGSRRIGCVGAVGIPFDGDERPCIAIVQDEGDGWSVEHIRVTYDREAYLAELTRSTIPGAETWVERIRAARPPA